MSWDSWAPLARTSSPLPPLRLRPCSALTPHPCAPIAPRWIPWPAWAARRTSNLRRACRTWATSTTSAPALAECPSTSAPYAATDPQVRWRGRAGGTDKHMYCTLPARNTSFHPDKWTKAIVAKICRLAVRFPFFFSFLRVLALICLTRCVAIKLLIRAQKTHRLAAVRSWLTTPLNEEIGGNSPCCFFWMKRKWLSVFWECNNWWICSQYFLFLL